MSAKPRTPSPFDRLAEQSHFNIYFSDLWQGTARRFAEAIVEECASMCMSQADRRNLRHAFGLPTESNVQYPAPDPHGSITSQYTRPYNLPRENNENT